MWYNILKKGCDSMCTSLLDPKKKLYVISSDEDEREKYRMREKARLDAASALATAELKGKAEGERLAKLSIAKSLLGIIPNELIAEKTGLSIEEIELLKY
ncbi:MAG: hypothetical protein ACRCW5_07815 [Cetobacterium sp.]|uniref:hypothetical protein n=1 Tax=Cetobacterium sp. TaxID=2071632 RepID=UPI003F354E71